MVFDVARGKTVLFGGEQKITPTTLNDTWTWDGKDWTQMTPATSPGPRRAAAMAYDSRRRRTVLFGGGARTVYLNDTWEWDGQHWTLMKPTNSPAAHRFCGNMVYDSRRGRMVMFGGLGSRSIFLRDTWEYVGPQSLSGSSPTISLATGGTLTLRPNAGTGLGRKLYWIFGSETGTTPGVDLLGVHV